MKTVARRQSSSPSPKKDPQTVIRRAIRNRLDGALSFLEMVNDDFPLDAIAELVAKGGWRREGTTVDARIADDQAIMAALPEDFQLRFRRYVDGLEDQRQSYAEAGYLIGLEVARGVRQLPGGGAR